MAREDAGAVPELNFRPAWITVSPDEAAAMGNKELDYDAIVRPLESRMMRAIWRIVREKETADDALQDALAKIWKKREAVANHPNPQALILRISVSAAYDALRKNRSRFRREIGGLPFEAAGDSAAPVAEEAEAASLRAAVLEAIGRLPRRQAAAALLRIVEEQTYEEIAQAMDCTATTARIHVMRARKALTLRLESYRPGSGGRAKGKDREPEP